MSAAVCANGDCKPDGKRFASDDFALLMFGAFGAFVAFACNDAVSSLIASKAPAGTRRNATIKAIFASIITIVFAGVCLATLR